MMRMGTFVKKMCVAAVAVVFLLQPLAMAAGTAAVRNTTAAPAFTRTLKLGCKGADVQALQKRLKDLGYFKATVTTNFGPVTLASVKSFQKAKHLTVDGIVGRVTFNKLYAGVPGTAAPTATATATATATPQNTSNAPAFTRTLKLGCKGADVQALQKRLKTLGYFKATVTTTFGPVTLAAVKAFQKAKHLTADGIVGRATHKALYAGVSAAPTPTPTATPTPAPTATPGKNTPGVPAFTRTLKLGCKGADVQALQQRLKTLGYFKASVTTTFGPVTLAAVKAFQKAKHLTADGIVGRVTHNALCAGARPSATPTPAASATAAPTASAYAYGRLQNQTALKTGCSGSDVRDLQMALKQKGFFNAEITGNFETLTREAVMKFQRSVGLDTDGIAGNYTLSALYSLLNPPDLSTIHPWPDLSQAAQWAALPVEKLTWADADRSAFPRRSEAVVVDVLTGYTLYIRRTGGTLHADVETVAPLDTATLFKTAGNFSWNRRAIWVIVNGRRLAASMNCMPHGYDSIAGNDMKGQFCIHFVNSRTHGGNRVDPDHQEAIEVAFTTVMTPPTPTPTSTPKASPTKTPKATTSTKTTATPKASPSPTSTFTEYPATIT